MKLHEISKKFVEMTTKREPLTYKVLAKCSTTKARVGVMSLLHSDVDTPVFMPVGTQVRKLNFTLTVGPFSS